MSSANMKKETITITKYEAVVNSWISKIQHRYKSSVVGLDTEWWWIRDENTGVHHYKIALLQLCVDDSCLIFQMKCWNDYVRDGNLSLLRDFLNDANFTFVGVGISGDLAMLRDEYQLHCARSKDLAEAAKKKWPGKWRQNPGLKTLAREVVGIEMEKDKRITLSKWGLSRLSEKQKEYASLDAYASYKIGVELQDYFDCPSPNMFDDDYYSDDDYY